MKSNVLYELVGEFCVRFEEICYAMENCAITILESAGLKNPAMQKIILAGLTADPLQRMLRALLAEHFDDAKIQSAISITFAEFEQLTKHRNSVIHGKWTPRVDDPKWCAENSFALSRKLKTSKNGEDSEYLKYSEDNFSKHIHDCQRVRALIERLDYLCNHKKSFSSMFEINNKELKIKS